MLELRNIYLRFLILSYYLNVPFRLCNLLVGVEWPLGISHRIFPALLEVARKIVVIDFVGELDHLIGWFSDAVLVGSESLRFWLFDLFLCFRRTWLNFTANRRLDGQCLLRFPVVLS